MKLLFKDRPLSGPTRTHIGLGRQFFIVYFVTVNNRTQIDRISQTDSGESPMCLAKGIWGYFVSLAWVRPGSDCVYAI